MNTMISRPKIDGESASALCPLCNMPSMPEQRAEVGWLERDVVASLVSRNPRWQREDGACPACVQSVLLQTLLERGDSA